MLKLAKIIGKLIGTHLMQPTTYGKGKNLSLKWKKNVSFMANKILTTVSEDFASKRQSKYGKNKIYFGCK